MKQIPEYSIDEIKEFLVVNELESEKENKHLEKLSRLHNKVFLFKDIDFNELKTIIDDLKFVKYSYKDFITNQGEISTQMFYIIQGECDVLYNNKKVGKLKSGEVFGENGAIFHTQRNASVVCSSEEINLLMFSLDQNNMEFCSKALATMYKNLSSEINSKLSELNMAYISK